MIKNWMICDSLHLEWLGRWQRDIDLGTLEGTVEPWVAVLEQYVKGEVTGTGK